MTMGAKKIYRVRLKKTFTSKASAKIMVTKIIKKGIPATVVNTKPPFEVQLGAFSIMDNARKRMAQANDAGFESFIMAPEDPVGAEKVYANMVPYIDSKTAHTDFIKEFNKMVEAIPGNHTKVKKSDAWCTEFVDLMFYKAGYLGLIGYARSSKDLMVTAKYKQTWKEGSYDIKYGDVIIYMDDHGEPNHTEFALDSHHFISGNYSGGVHKRYRKSLKNVKGRIRPKYPK